MMHGREKSDHAIVAMKPTNKAERSATELVERRAGTEGNAGRLSTRWAQSQISVTQDVGSSTASICRRYPRWEPYAGKPHVRIWCSEASCHSSGWKSRQQRSPVAVVVISSNGEGNRSVGSLGVKAPEGRAYRSDPYRGASNLAGRSKCVNREAPKDVPRVKRIAGRLGGPSRSDLGEGDVGIEVWTGDDELPGVIESGMPRRNGQRKPGTTRGSPRRSPHSEGIAYKPPCGEIAMCSRVGRMGSIK